MWSILFKIYVNTIILRNHFFRVSGYNTPFYLFSDNTPRCVRKHINVCTKVCTKAHPPLTKIPHELWSHVSVRESNSHVYLHSRMKIHMIPHVKMHRFQIHMCIYIHKWKFTWFHMWKFTGSKFTCVFIFTNENSHDFTCENSEVPNSHVYLYSQMKAHPPLTKIPHELWSHVSVCESNSHAYLHSRMKIHMIPHVKMHRFQIHMCIYIHKWKFTWFHMWKFTCSKYTCVFIFTKEHSHDCTCENSQVPNIHVNFHRCEFMSNFSKDEVPFFLIQTYFGARMGVIHPCW